MSGIKNCPELYKKQKDLKHKNDVISYIFYIK